MINYREKRGIDQWAVNAQNHHPCGGTFTDLFGIIKSPGYPLYYPNKKVCLQSHITYTLITTNLDLLDYHILKQVVPDRAHFLSS